MAMKAGRASGNADQSASIARCSTSGVVGVLLGHVEAEPAGVALEATASAFRRWRAAISATAPAAIKVPSTAPSIDAPRR
jgi:hypothetical protein